jgi:hypothetical protein
MGSKGLSGVKRAAALGIANWIASIRVPHFLLRTARVRVDQSDPGRDAAIRALMRDHCHGPVSLLEIGSWFGEGSTRIWLEVLPEGSDLVLLDRWAAYVSAEDAGKGSAGYFNMDRFHRSALVNTADVVDRHPRNKSIETSIVRSEVGSFGKYMKPDLFDIIYIDGSHYYDDVKRDIEFAKKAINKKFGIICGDDLEILPDKEMIEHARAFKNRDFVAFKDQYFHPGVALAVAEEFEQVSMAHGFWWIFCQDGVFSSLPPGE